MEWLRGKQGPRTIAQSSTNAFASPQKVTRPLHFSLSYNLCTLRPPPPAPFHSTPPPSAPYLGAPR